MPANMMQGDQYAIPIYAEGFDVSDIESIRFYIGGLLKTYPDSVAWDGQNSRFLFPILQSETFAMPDRVFCQARIKFMDSGDVIGVKMGYLNVAESLDKAVM